jgi:hypothetical protein
MHRGIEDERTSLAEYGIFCVVGAGGLTKLKTFLFRLHVDTQRQTDLVVVAPGRPTWLYIE